MREFEISLTKTLNRGLRPFPENPNNPLFLEECFNWMPSELALRPHEPLSPIGISQGAFFNYLEIKDQNGISWYWYPVFDGHILAGSGIPSEPSTGLVAIPITPITIPYWVEILDESSVVWYLYPDSTSGFTRARDTVPPVGTGMENLLWRGTTSEWWRIRFSVAARFDNPDHTRYAVKAG